MKAANAAEFLSLVPRLLGFRPVDSLVLVPFDGSRSIGAMRIDLPDAAPAALDSVASTIIGLVCRVADADAVAIVAYTGARFEGDAIPHRDLADALLTRADACGLRVTDALCVGADGWGSYLDDACPPGGNDLAELDGVAALRGLSARARLDADQESGAALPDVGESEREAVAIAVSALDDAVEALCRADSGGGSGGSGAGAGRETGREPALEPAHEPALEPAHEPGLGRAADTAHAQVAAPHRGAAFGPAAEARPAGGPGSEAGPITGIGADAATSPAGSAGPSGAGASAGPSAPLDPRALELVVALDDLPELFEAVVRWTPESIAAGDAALLAWCLARPSLRDIAIVQWAAGAAYGDRALDAQLRWEHGEEYPADLARVMWGEGDTPDPERLQSVLAVVRRVAASAPRSVAAGSLATAAWLAWALGRSTHAAVHAGAARDVDPEHGLAGIVQSFVDAGHLPDWAFRSRGARVI